MPWKAPWVLRQFALLNNGAERTLSQHARRTKAINKYLENGGLPGLFQIREPSTRKNLLRDLIETILDRDLRLVYRTSLPYQRIYDYCVSLARAPLRIVRPGTLSKTLRITESTQQHLLHALESIFIVRRIPVEGDYKGDLFWFEEQTERTHFISENTWDDEDWITMIFRNARAQFNYRLGEHPYFFHYRTPWGSSGPLSCQDKSGSTGYYRNSITF